MIAEGRIALNGTVIDTPATLLSSLDGVTVDGDPVAAPEPTRLFLYNKPTGLLVTEHDPAGRPTIYDRLPSELPRVVPVGRLDLNTEGLLLLTTDGGFKRQLELPATGVERTYRARAYGDVTQAQLEELIHGIEIDGIRYGQIDANLERRTGANVWIEMTLREGKNREVRRVLEHMGLQVSRLIRLRYGPFVLADLPAGEVGEVKGSAIVEFRKTLLGGIPADAVRPSPRDGFRAAPTRAATPRARSEPTGEARPERTPRLPSGQGDRTRPVAKRADARPERDDRPRRGAEAPSLRSDQSSAPRGDDRAAFGGRGKPFAKRPGGDRNDGGAASASGRSAQGERGKPFDRRDTAERGDRAARGGAPAGRSDRFAPNGRGSDGRDTERSSAGERGKPFAKRPSQERGERGDRPDRGSAAPSGRQGRPPSGRPEGKRPTNRPGGGARPGRPRGNR